MRNFLTAKNVTLINQFFEMYENLMSNDLTHLSVEQIEQAASSLNVGSAVDVFGLSVECIFFTSCDIFALGSSV